MSAPLTITLDASPFRDALRDFSLLLVECPEDVVPGIVEAIHSPLTLCVIESDGLAASLAGHSRLVMKPSERFLMLMAAARAGKFDRGVVENLAGHNSSSVGCVEPTNEDRAPGESQGSFGGPTRNSQPLSQQDARALCDAGYMPLPEYLRLSSENGWTAEASV